MKSFIKYIILTLSILSFHQLSASDKKVKTDTIEVQGTCNMCKKRIENAAYIKGVKRADWDKSTKKLVVTYNSTTTDLNKIAEAISKVGHDAHDQVAASDKYNSLPNCCAYRSGNVCEH